MSTQGHSPITTPRRAPRPCTSGFSLIELILVITIISILAAIAVPRYANALARYRADAAANKLVADLEYARRRARNTSSAVTVHVLPNTDNLKILNTQDINLPGNGYQTYFDRNPYNADVTNVNFNDDYIVIFDGYGYPDSGGTVQLNVGFESRTVTLNAETGRAVAQ